MKIFRRTIQFTTLPDRLYSFIKAVITIPVTFQQPGLVLFHYLTSTLPSQGYVKLKNGFHVVFSGHKHDLISTIIVWCKKDYGTVTKGSVCVDIGANIGMFSLFAAAQGAAEVYAYEANQTAFTTMVRNIANNHLDNCVHPFHYAVTDQSGRYIAFPSVPSPYNRIQSSYQGTFEEVETISLNDIVKKINSPEIDLVQMDIEGAEYQVFAKVQDETLQRIKEIRMEYHAGPLEELCNRLCAAGFRIARQKAEQERSGIIWFKRNTA